jgi:hypothetical protein
LKICLFGRSLAVRLAIKSLMSEWETKIAAIINETKNENVTSFAGVPS